MKKQNKKKLYIVYYTRVFFSRSLHAMILVTSFRFSIGFCVVNNFYQPIIEIPWIQPTHSHICSFVAAYSTWIMNDCVHCFANILKCIFGLASWCVQSDITHDNGTSFFFFPFLALLFLHYYCLMTHLQ